MSSRVFDLAQRFLAPLVLGQALLACRSERTTSTQQEVGDRNRLIEKEAALIKADRAFWVSNRPEIRFLWGFSLISYDPKDDFHNRAFRWIGAKSVLSLRSSSVPMQLQINGWVDNNALRTKPTLSLYVDKRILATTEPLDGIFEIKALIPPEWMQNADFTKVEVVLSSVAFHWVDPPELKVALFTHVSWRPTP